MNKVIDDFFQINYTYLLDISNKYLKRFNFRTYSGNELLSDYYLHIYSNSGRTLKYEKVIKEGNGLRYMIHSIKINSKNHQKFIEDFPHQKKMFYTDYLIDEIEDKEESFEKECLADIIEAAKKIKDKKNYYKYEVWEEHYLKHLTYKELTKKIDLTTSPIWGIVQDYNNLIKKELGIC